ncbi:MAG: sialidase family protein, partial [Gemmatimonadota bacterium]
MRRAAPLLLATGWILAAPIVGAPSDTLEFKAPTGTVTPNLAVGAGGRTILTWLEPNPSGSAALRFAVRTAGRWSAPATIVENDRFFVNWADFPSLIETADGQWVVHFLEKTEAKPYAYHVRLMTSKDQGRTWSAPSTAHDATSPTEPGVVAMVPR